MSDGRRSNADVDVVAEEASTGVYCVRWFALCRARCAVSADRDSLVTFVN